VLHKPKLLSDNGPSYIATELAEWICIMPPLVVHLGLAGEFMSAGPPGTVDFAAGLYVSAAAVAGVVCVPPIAAEQSMDDRRARRHRRPYHVGVGTRTGPSDTLRSNGA
jgi:hypothetical protein